MRTNLPAEFETYLYNWVSNVLGSDFLVIWDYEDVVRPKADFAALQVITPNLQAVKPASQCGDDDKLVQDFHRTFMFSVNMYSHDGHEFAQRLDENQFHPDTIDEFGKVNLSCMYTEYGTAEPITMNDHFEYFTNVSFIFSYATRTEIDRVRISVIRGTAFGKPYEITIT